MEGLIQNEIEAGIPSTSIAVVGFSQGGAIALMMLRSKLQLAAIVGKTLIRHVASSILIFQTTCLSGLSNVGMSTYIVLRSEPSICSTENSSTPVLLCHGDQDGVVYYDNCKLSLQLLQKAGVNVECKVYKGMQHSACPEEFEDVKKFLAAALQT